MFEFGLKDIEKIYLAPPFSKFTTKNSKQLENTFNVMYFYSTIFLILIVLYIVVYIILKSTKPSIIQNPNGEIDSRKLTLYSMIISSIITIIGMLIKLRN